MTGFVVVQTLTVCIVFPVEFSIENHRIMSLDYRMMEYTIEFI